MEGRATPALIGAARRARQKYPCIGIGREGGGEGGGGGGRGGGREGGGGEKLRSKSIDREEKKRCSKEKWR